MKTLTVGIIGAGDIVRKVHLPVLLNLPHVQVEWILDAMADRARAVGSAYRITGVPPCEPKDLPPCDVALIAIPVGARDGYFDEFAKRGTAVLAEKPVAVSAAAHQALLDRFAPQDLGCAYMRRFYSSTRLLRQLVRDGGFGPPIRLQIFEGSRATGSRVDRTYMDDSRLLAAGGILSELGCHTIDQALLITGAREYTIHSCDLALDGAIDRQVCAQLTLRGSDLLPASGLPLEYRVSWLERQPNTIVVEFHRTVIWAETRPGADVYVGSPSQPSLATKLTPPHTYARTANQAFFLQWQAFLAGVRARSESEISARSALLGTHLIEDLYAAGRH